MAESHLISLSDSVVNVQADTWILLTMSGWLAAICNVEYETCDILTQILQFHRSDTSAGENPHIKLFYNL